MKNHCPVFIALVLISLLGLRCEPSTFEKPNTSVDTARTVANGETVEGAFNGSEAKLFYRFTLEETCIVKAIVEKAPSNNYAVEVFDDPSEYKMIAGTGWIGKGQDITIWAGPLEKGEHKIRVSRQFPDSLFKFRIEYDCSDKTEKNDLFDQATPISSGQPISGYVLAVNNYADLEDVDIYKFEVVGKPAGAWVTFKAPNAIAPNPNSRVVVALYNIANENTRLEYMNYIEQGQVGTMALGPLSVGTHYLSVNYDGECNCQSTEPYQLTLDIDYSDEYEPNDLPFENATYMELDRLYKGTILYPNSQGQQDQDWFKFIPQQGGKYKIQMVDLPSNWSTNCYVYASPPGNGNYALYFYSNDGLSDERELTLNAGTEYWFKVEMGYYYYESAGQYQLKIIKI